MEITSDLGDFLTGVAAIATVLVTIVTLSSSKARIHKVARETMELAKSLEEQIERHPSGPARSTAIGLRNELLVRGHYVTKRYLERTTLKRLTLIEAVAWAVILILMATTVWSIRGVPADLELWRKLLGWIVLGAALVTIGWGVYSSHQHMKIEEALDVMGRDFLDQDPPSRAGRYVLLGAGIFASVGILGLMRWKRTQ